MNRKSPFCSVGGLLLALSLHGQAVTLSVNLVNAPAEVTAAWNAFTGGGALNLNSPGGFTPGTPGIHFRSADMETGGIFDVAGIGAGNGPGRVIVNAEARARNFGGRSGELVLTDLTLFSSVPGPIVFDMTVREEFGIDVAWLNNLPGASQFGWNTGLAAQIEINDINQSANIAIRVPGSTIHTANAPALSAGVVQLVPVTAGPVFYNVGAGPSFVSGVRPPNGTATFDVQYTTRFTLTGGNPNDEVEIRMENSLDGLGVGDAFGDFTIPEPGSSLLLCLAIPVLARRRR